MEYNLKCVTKILFCFLFFFCSGDAIKCWRCNSRADPNCVDTFSNYSIPTVSCTQTHAYDLTPIEKCIKIKYKTTEGLVFERGCDRKQQYQNAEYFWCNTDLCNTADNHRPKLLLTILFTSLLAIKLLRF